jgi:hypothetical protein
VPPYNETAYSTGLFTVTDVISHTDPSILQVTIAGEVLETTAEHPFYTWERGWVGVGELRIGEHVHRANDGYGIVQAVVVVRHARPMYNLTVAVAHTFFVGQGRWLVHNSRNCRVPDPSSLINPIARRYAERISNAINDHLKPSDLEGAWRDLHGNPVPNPTRPGHFYDHYGEVSDALRSLRNSIDEFKELLKDPSLSGGDQAVVQQYLSAASKTMDYVEEVVHRDQWFPGTQVPFP